MIFRIKVLRDKFMLINNNFTIIKNIEKIQEKPLKNAHFIGTNFATFVAKSCKKVAKTWKMA